MVYFILILNTTAWHICSSFPSIRFIYSGKVGKWFVILRRAAQVGYYGKSLSDFVTPHQRKSFSPVCNEPDGYYRLVMDKYLAGKDIVLNPYMKVESTEAVKRCVMNHLGIAVAPTYSIGEELKNGSLMPVKTELDEKDIICFILLLNNLMCRARY